MSKKFYKIRQIGKKTVIEEMSLVKETDKTYVLFADRMNHTVRKVTLPFYWSYDILITDDLEAGKAEWNREKLECIEKYQRRIDICKSSLIEGY